MGYMGSTKCLICGAPIRNEPSECCDCHRAAVNELAVAKGIGFTAALRLFQEEFWDKSIREGNR